MDEITYLFPNFNGAYATNPHFSLIGHESSSVEEENEREFHNQPRLVARKINSTKVSNRSISEITQPLTYIALEYMYLYFVPLSHSEMDHVE